MTPAAFDWLVLGAVVSLASAFLAESVLWRQLNARYIRLVARLPLGIGEPLPPSTGELVAGFEGEGQVTIWREVDGEVLFRGGGAVGRSCSGRIVFGPEGARVLWAPFPALATALALAGVLAIAVWSATGSLVVFFGFLVFWGAAVAASVRSSQKALRESIYLEVETRLMEHVRQIEEA